MSPQSHQAQHPWVCSTAPRPSRISGWKQNSPSALQHWYSNDRYFVVRKHSPGRRAIVAHPATSLLQRRSEEHTSELQSLMRISYAVFCLKKKIKIENQNTTNTYYLHITITKH